MFIFRPAGFLTASSVQAIVGLSGAFLILILIAIMVVKDHALCLAYALR
jgi:hypothetical protein